MTSKCCFLPSREKRESASKLTSVARMKSGRAAGMLDVGPCARWQLEGGGAPGGDEG